jgi:hypothetical protein
MMLPSTATSRHQHQHSARPRCGSGQVVAPPPRAVPAARAAAVVARRSGLTAAAGGEKLAADPAVPAAPSSVGGFWRCNAAHLLPQDNASLLVWSEQELQELQVGGVGRGRQARFLLTRAPLTWPGWCAGMVCPDAALQATAQAFPPDGPEFPTSRRSVLAAVTCSCCLELLRSPQLAAADTGHFDYSGGSAEGPSHWPAACSSGSQQSPINLQLPSGSCSRPDLAFR